jgi:hypothetical protein
MFDYDLATQYIHDLIIFALIVLMGILIKRIILLICDNDITKFNIVVFLYYTFLIYIRKSQLADTVLYVGIMINGLFLITK